MHEHRILVNLSGSKATGLVCVGVVAIGWLWLQPFLVSGSIDEFLATRSIAARGWPSAAVASLVFGAVLIGFVAKIAFYRGSLLTILGSSISSPYFRKPIPFTNLTYTLKWDPLGYSTLLVLVDGIALHKVPLILASGAPSAILAGAVALTAPINADNVR